MNERIRQIIDYYNITIRQFEQKISASEGQIYKGLSRKSDFGSATIAKILDSCPDISPDWLLLGRGEMLRKNSIDADNSTTSADLIMKLTQQIADLARENGQLQAENEELKKENAHLENVVSAARATAVSA